MPANTPALGASALRGEIENVLSQKIAGTPISGTLTWLTAELGGAGKSAEAQVAIELAALELEGRVTTRVIPRSGELVWKLTDKHHAQWQAANNLQATPTLNRSK